MAVLHLLANPGAATSCFDATAECDSLLLLGDGVFALNRGIPAQGRIGILRDDALSRGVEAANAVEVLSYADFVAWVVEHRCSVTWS